MNYILSCIIILLVILAIYYNWKMFQLSKFIKNENKNGPEIGKKLGQQLFGIANKSGSYDDVSIQLLPNEIAVSLKGSQIYTLPLGCACHLGEMLVEFYKLKGSPPNKNDAPESASPPR